MAMHVQRQGEACLQRLGAGPFEIAVAHLWPRDDEDVNAKGYRPVSGQKSHGNSEAFMPFGKVIAQGESIALAEGPAMYVFLQC
jgi:hypothetical protein